MNDLFMYLKRLLFIISALLICAFIIKLGGKEWGAIIIFTIILILVKLNKGRRL